MSLPVLGLVSIIVPAYNAGKFIAESIDSVIAQTYSNWELLIVDDGSIDNTKEVVQFYSQRDERVKYIHQENGRQGKARNNGLRHACGEYVAFLDADDLWLPNKLAIQLQEIADYKADLVFANSFIFSDRLEYDDKGQINLPTINAAPGVYTGDSGLAEFLYTNKIPILTVLVKRAAVTSVGGFAEDRLIQNSEDFHLWVKLLLQGYTLVGSDKILAAYRKHANSVSDDSGFNFPFVIEAKLNLAELYPDKRNVILSTVSKTILMSLPEVDSFSDSNFYQKINRYLLITSKQEWLPVLKMLQKVGARKLALRLTYFIFNYK